MSLNNQSQEISRSTIRSIWLGPARARRLRNDAGQTTAEYALVLLGVAAIAMLLLAWARGTGAFTDLFDAVLDSIVSLVP